MKNSVKKTSIAITQPNFIPWLGYFEMIDRVDIFVYLDDVQYPTNRREWINRNRIASKKNCGWDWITVSIPHTGNKHNNINDTSISNQNIWFPNLRNKIINRYSNTPFFKLYSLDFFNILSNNFTDIANLNISIIEWALDIFKIKTKTIRSSSLKTTGAKDNKLLSIYLFLMV